MPIRAVLPQVYQDQSGTPEPRSNEPFRFLAS